MIKIYSIRCTVRCPWCNKSMLLLHQNHHQQNREFIKRLMSLTGNWYCILQIQIQIDCPGNKLNGKTKKIKKRIYFAMCLANWLADCALCMLNVIEWNRMLSLFAVQCMHVCVHWHRFELNCCRLPTFRFEQVVLACFAQIARVVLRVV